MPSSRRKLRVRGENIMPAARCILPVELKSCHQLSLRGQYTDLGKVERSSCGGDQTMIAASADFPYS